MSTFLVYLYKKKPLRALKHLNTWTPVHQILCSNSMFKFCATCATCAIILIIKLSIFLSMFHWLLLYTLRDIIHRAQRADWYYLSCSACWLILSILLSVLIDIIYQAQRTDWYYLSSTPKWFILFIVHLLRRRIKAKTQKIMQQNEDAYFQKRSRIFSRTNTQKKKQRKRRRTLLVNDVSLAVASIVDVTTNYKQNIPTLKNVIWLVGMEYLYCILEAWHYLVITWVGFP